MKPFWFLYILFLSSVFVLGTIFFQLTPRYSQQLIAIFVITILLTFKLSSLPGKKAQWLLLFCTTSIVELIVLSTGGYESPFFMLIHFFVLGLSLLFAFIAGVFFLLFASALILYQGMTSGSLVGSFILDPASVLLPVLSLFLIVPVSYELARRYQIKDKLSQLLLRQLEVEESILSEIEEYVFVTDPIGVLVSLNEPASRMVTLSDTQIIRQNIFAIFGFKDTKGERLTAESLHLAQIVQGKKVVTVKGITLTTPVTSQKGTLRVKPVTSYEGKNVPQVVFIFFPEYK